MLHLGPVKLDSPAVMGVLNVTPDSFSDGGRYSTIDVALRHAQQMAEQGRNARESAKLQQRTMQPIVDQEAQIAGEQQRQEEGLGG